MTRYEQIRAMSVDEMAAFFDRNLSCIMCSRRNLDEGCDEIEDCKPYIKIYLESEAD